MSNKKHLPLMGVGPVYVALIITITILGLNLSQLEVFKSGHISILQIPFDVLGAALIIIGALLWSCAVFKSRMDKNIKSNTLVTTGIYSYVRNPMYSAFMSACTGVLLINNNLYLLILPIIFWALMTIIMKNTEEKWLANLYGDEYLEYCKRVNRCIPWKSR